MVFLGAPKNRGGKMCPFSGLEGMGSIVHELRDVGRPQQLHGAVVGQINGGLAEDAQAHAGARKGITANPGRGSLPTTAAARCEVSEHLGRA